MARIPTVAIIGRPNVGKSTLFNRIIGRRRSIVSDVPGTTRDHVAAKVETDAMDFLLVDTGGMGGGTADEDFEDDVHAQSLLALTNADLIVFVLSGREELTSSDFAVAEALRTQKRPHVPVILAVNKLDNPGAAEELLPPFYALGIGDDVLPISASHGTGVDALVDAIVKHLRDLHFTAPTPDAVTPQAPRIALVGRPNVGKSSLVNALMSPPQRAASPRLVSDIPGTTRDRTDTVIRFQEQEYVFMDTAGIKRRSGTEKGIETFATLRSLQAISEADICVLILDASVPVTRQDKRIAQLASEQGKGLIIAANKVDLLSAGEREQAIKHIEHELLFCRFAPLLPVSAITREGLLRLFELIAMVERNRTRRIPTKDLHNWYATAVRGQPMATLSSAKHITQADALPPTFVVFVKNPKQVRISELKYLDRKLRETFGFEGTPVRWITKSSG